jgi:hypothetical protein
MAGLQGKQAREPEAYVLYAEDFVVAIETL